MRRTIRIILAAALVAVPSSALACSIRLPPLEKMARDIAADGVFISGTLVQRFDPSKEHPEIIRADEIYVGEGEPRDFVIYRSAREYELARDPSQIRSSCEHTPYPYELGHRFERLILEQIRSDGPAHGQWRFSRGVAVSHGDGLRLLMDEARQSGRFRKEPE